MDLSHYVHPYSFMPELPLAERWQRLRPVISTLYIDEGRKLDDVIEILRRQHGFDASKHQYKYHIRQWKLKKSIPKTAKRKMYEMVEHRAARGKPTFLEYRGKAVDSRKLVRHAKDRPNKSLVRRSVFNSGTDSAARRNGPTIHLVPAIFMKWNMPYAAFRNSRVGAVDYDSPYPFGPSPASDIVAITPSFTGVLSPSADSPSHVSKALFNKTALERAHLFLGGKYSELIKSMGKQETIIVSTWLYQFWMFAFRTARHWGKGPRNWTKELLDLDNHLEKLSISADPTPAAIAPSPAAGTTPVTAWLTDGITPSILCNWAVHVPEMYYEPIHSRSSDDLDAEPANPLRDGKDWPSSWSKPSFVDRLQNGLRDNLFSNIEEEDLPIAIPRLLRSANMSRDEFLEEALGFSIVGRSVDALHSVVRKMRRAHKKVETLSPFHLATSYLSGSDPCCNVFSFMVCRPSLFPLRELYLDHKGHSVLDNLMIAILKSHTSCVPADVDESMEQHRRFEGEEVDVCGRWDADSDELRGLLVRGEPRIPFDWKHKFCHTSVQVICHCISLLFCQHPVPDVNSTLSGLFRKKCQHCSRDSKLLPLHAMVMTAILLAERGTADEDLFGMIACLLCLLRKGAKPSLKTELSVDALWGDSSSTACVHESLDAVQLAGRVPADRIQNWTPGARTGWKLFCYVLRAARRLEEPDSPVQDVVMWDDPPPVEGMFDVFFLPNDRDTGVQVLGRQHPADDDADSADEEISRCISCGESNNFKDCGQLGHLWAAVQAEILTYRRLRDLDNWLSDNFDMEEVLEGLEAGNGIRTGFFHKELLRAFCACGGFESAKQPDFACVDEVCCEYFSNLEEWERTTYLWCPELIDEEDEIDDLWAGGYDSSSAEEEDQEYDQDEDGDVGFDDVDEDEDENPQDRFGY